MVCFVHDRRFLSKFHGTINKLRQTNEFTNATLQQLPKRCCSCREKIKDPLSTEAEPLLKSLDIDTLQLICLRHDLEQSIKNNISLSSSKIHDYTILLFPTSIQTNSRDIITQQFIIQQNNQSCSLQEIYHVDLNFITSNSSEELLSAVAHWQYDLVIKISNYVEAKRAIDGLWIIISADDQTRIDTVKYAFQRQWKRFLNKINMNSKYTIYNGQQQNFSSLIKNKCSNTQRSQIQHANELKNQQTNIKLYDEIDDDAEDLVENVLTSPNTRFQYLFSKYQNSNRSKRPRTHRRQHILALAMVA